MLLKLACMIHTRKPKHGQKFRSFQIKKTVRNLNAKTWKVTAR